MIMFLDYVIYWMGVLFIFCAIDKIFKKEPLKLIISKNLIQTGVFSLLIYLTIFYFSRELMYL
jgi:uncharacterized MnhB-related membrane protein